MIANHMSEEIQQDHLQADLSRVEKLKELSRSGVIDRPLSYFNHLIDLYGDPGRMGPHRTFTDRERERVDLFLASFTTPISHDDDRKVR